LRETRKKLKNNLSKVSPGKKNFLNRNRRDAMQQFNRIIFLTRISVLRILCVLTLLTCLAFGSIAARAATPPYDAIYVFGDSYCDVGNIYAATSHTIPPSPPYFNGRFSNGPIWIEHVAGVWGLPMVASLVPGGTDYAFGGAYVTIPENISLGIPPSVPQQVEAYLSSVQGHADPKALYVIEGGGNDILGAGAAGASGVTAADNLGYQIARGISEGELALLRAGAENFLIPDLVDVGQLPAATAFASFASAATVATNKELDRLLRFEESFGRVRVHRLDVFSLFHDIAADPTHFGFTNITIPCLILNPLGCADPDHTLFWDAEHPTEFGHAFFAVMVEATLGIESERLKDPR
jgi:outer membrane lipase/esterase